MQDHYTSSKVQPAKDLPLLLVSIAKTKKKVLKCLISTGHSKRSGFRQQDEVIQEVPSSSCLERYSSERDSYQKRLVVLVGVKSVCKFYEGGFQQKLVQWSSTSRILKETSVQFFLIMFTTH